MGTAVTQMNAERPNDAEAKWFDIKAGTSAISDNIRDEKATKNISVVYNGKQEPWHGDNVLILNNGAGNRGTLQLKFDDEAERDRAKRAVMAVRMGHVGRNVMRLDRRRLTASELLEARFQGQGLLF